MMLSLLQGFDPLFRFILVALIIAGFFTSVNYVVGRITIMLRGYPPPHCCHDGEEVVAEIEKEDDD
jgi:hypothetical protein